MNRQEKNQLYIENRKKILPQYGQGCVKITNETLEHFLVKSQVMYWLHLNKWETYSECFIQGSKARPDIVALNKNGMAYCIEILKSESDKMCDTKDYPFPIIKVYVKDFDYKTFCL
jgi:hypothetical protein